MLFGGDKQPGLSNDTESYDGTSWTNGPDMGTAREALAGGQAGTTKATFAAGGSTGSNSQATEEFTSVATARSVDTT